MMTEGDEKAKLFFDELKENGTVKVTIEIPYFIAEDLKKLAGLLGKDFEYVCASIMATGWSILDKKMLRNEV